MDDRFLNAEATFHEAAPELDSGEVASLKNDAATSVVLSALCTPGGTTGFQSPATSGSVIFQVFDPVHRSHIWSCGIHYLCAR